MKYPLLLATTIATMALSGCANYPVSTSQPFQEKDLNHLVRSGELQQTTHTFFVINDSSSSMSDPYLGSGFSGQSSKLGVGKALLQRMNKTIPDITLSSGLRSFGYGPCLSYSFTKLNQPLQSYTPSGFESAINTLECSSGGTPVASSFEALSSDLASAQGNIGVILVSDGHNYDISPIPAIKALQTQYGDKLCIHTVWVGNEKEMDGQAVLKDIANMSGCGISTTASNIASSSGMADFVTQVFFKVVPAAPVTVELDSDGDGVVDSKDKCPNTPKGAIVDKYGCWAFSGVLFDFDKSTIRAGYETLFDNAIKVLKMNLGLTVEIQGHTDNRGADMYNQKLSEDRAATVRRYLINNGIDGSRLTTRGFGESSPITSNVTDAGRAENRRVVYKRTDM